MTWRARRFCTRIHLGRRIQARIGWLGTPRNDRGRRGREVVIESGGCCCGENVAVLGLNAVHGLTRVLKRERKKDLPIPLPCRPLPLADLTSEEFLSRILKLRIRLTRNRSAELAGAACEELQALKRGLLRSPAANADLKREDASPTASFQSCWRPLFPGYSSGSSDYFCKKQLG
jgi:hypothetical protein